MHAVDDNQRWRHLPIVGNPRTFALFRQPFSNVRGARGRVARPKNGHPLPSNKTLLSYVKATGRFHLRPVVRHAA
jgi:hypothetical protein